jgi:glycosyltransferase involved in cell wall biosynthesis
LRLAVVSPFLDRQHGTEACLIEQIERLASRDRWEIHLYSQRVQQVEPLFSSNAPPPDLKATILWHRVSQIPGPHLFKYIWWFLANHFRRLGNHDNAKFRPDLTYSPGINCLDADAIVVHIVFCEFYQRIRSELGFSGAPLTSWPLLLHRRIYYRLIMFLEKRIYSNPRLQLAAVSHLVSSQLRSHFNRSDAVVIPNAVDTLRFNPQACVANRSSARASFHLNEADFVLLFIGNDWKTKGLHCLLTAMGSLRELPLRLIVVGNDHPGPFQALLDQSSLRDRVQFRKPSSDVLSFYAATDAYVAPSLQDSFGLPILEAMACGLPVVASVQAGASENIRDAQSGLLLNDPRDAAELARLIERLFSDKLLRDRLGAAAAAYAHENCSWEQNALRTREFLENTLLRRSNS